MGCSISILVWSGLCFPVTVIVNAGALMFSPLCRWLSAGLGNWLTLVSSAQLPCTLPSHNLRDQDSCLRMRVDCPSSQNLKFFPSLLFMFPSSAPSASRGRIRQWKDLRRSWFQPMGQGLRLCWTWRGNCRDLVRKNILKSGENTGVLILKPRGPPGYRNNDPEMG